MCHIALSRRKSLFWTWIFTCSCLLSRVQCFGRSFQASKAFYGSDSEPWRPRRSRINRFERTQLQDTSNINSAEDFLARNEIVVSSEIHLPFPAQIAYDAFSDMSRQTSWSPWLHSVEYTDQSRNSTLWKMKYLGVSTSWVSICTFDARPHTICWKSIKGLSNRGRVDFVPGGKHSTRMKMTMTFQVPRLIARMFTSNGKVSQMVEERMLFPTLERFCRDIVQNDYPAAETMIESTSIEMPVPTK